MWIVPDSLRSRFSADTGDSTSGSSEPLAEWATDSTLPLTWNGKPIPLRSSSSGWKSADCLRRLSGRTLPPSMADPFVDWWTSWLADSRARTSPSPVEAPASVASAAASSTRSSAFWARLERALSSSRTSRGCGQAELFATEPMSSPTSTRCEPPRSLRGSVGTRSVTWSGYTGDFSRLTEYPLCTMSSADWQRWATTLTRHKSRLRTSARPIDASGSSCWPTPDAAVMNDGEAPESFERRRAALAAKGINGNGAGTPLAQATKTWSAQWATPTSPPSHPDLLTPIVGEPSSSDGPSSRRLSLAALTLNSLRG